jgi:hypothetical protein
MLRVTISHRTFDAGSEADAWNPTVQGPTGKISKGVLELANLT